jgi:hypothetical protein
LDDKLEDVVTKIRALPCGQNNPAAPWDNAYVAYRAIWADVTKNPEARVVDPSSSAPTATYFPGETLYDVGLSFDLTTDITDFFLWVYDKCPANHYAVFFWGHAMGPGGLFEQSERPIVISPPLMFVLRFARRLIGRNRYSAAAGIRSLQRALRRIVLRRIADQRRTTMGSSSYLPPRIPPVAPGTMPPPPPLPSSPPLPVPPGQAVPKVDAVLFQDCWMAGIETAFELQDDVRYIVASQSLVPIGLKADGSPGAVWPYQKMIERMMADPNNFGPALLTELENFFKAGGDNLIPAKRVLYSLMDCDVVAGAVTGWLQAPFQALVQALCPIGPQDRSKLIDQKFMAAGRLFEMSSNTLEVGDEALIDILTMCAFLKDYTQWPWPGTFAMTVVQRDAIVAAAITLEVQIKVLRKGNFEVSVVAASLPYSGVTALYKPFNVLGVDPYIVNNTYRASYDGFRFAQETTVTLVGGPPGSPPCSWADFAFERTHW